MALRIWREQVKDPSATARPYGPEPNNSVFVSPVPGPPRPCNANPISASPRLCVSPVRFWTNTLASGRLPTLTKLSSLTKK